MYPGKLELQWVNEKLGIAKHRHVVYILLRGADLSKAMQRGCKAVSLVERREPLGLHRTGPGFSAQ